MKLGTLPARAARTVTAVAAAIAIGIGAASAAAAVTTDYHPTQEARDFADSAGGWTATTTQSGLLCIAGVTCPIVTNDYIATDGAGGPSDGLIRTNFQSTLLSLVTTVSATWESPEFTYTGVGGYTPDSVSFSLDRQTNVSALLLVSGARYRAELQNVTTPGTIPLLANHSILAETPAWATASAPVDPALLTIGSKYRIRVVTEVDTVAGVLPAAQFDYDNVRLRADATDTDNDGLPDSTDNCDTLVNPAQTDTDGDGIGDACDANPTVPDTDTDGDGVPDATDNCDTTKNPNQSDKDKDGIGDACDSTPNGPDTDGDGVPNTTDNCVNVANPGQSDMDGDGIGDMCDSTPNGPATGTCQGSAAQVQVGQSTGETLKGTDANDLIKGEKGNDRIVGKGGNDCLKGGAGKDTMRGQGGKDVLSGNAGRDVLTGENGNDRLRGQAGNDKLKGARDNDKLNGGKGKDRLNGGVGNDLLLGGNDADRLNGGKGKDVLNSGRGNDWVYAFDGKADVVRCGGGIDRVVVDAKDKVSVSCEKVLVRT